MTVGITFGRFRIFHAGHINLIQRMIDENSEVIIGVAKTSEAQRSAQVIRYWFGNSVTVEYFNNPFQMMSALELKLTPRFYAGSDRYDMLSRLKNYHEVDIIPVERSLCSSTVCREILSTAGTLDDLISSGLAVDHNHAMIIYAQFILERVK